MSLREQFPRTECACAHCQVGCRTMPGMCSIGDVARIVDDQIGIASQDAEQFIATHFVASEGAKVAKMERCGAVTTFNIPTISPAQQPSGACVFFDGERCMVHAVSPGGCALVDTHMTRDQGDVIVGAMLAEIHADKLADGPYWRLWQHLKASGRIARPRLERREAFEREFAQAGPCQQRTPQQSLGA